MNRMFIIGAGLAGLIAACKFKDVPIIEAAPRPMENHKAVLRFRDDGVSKLTGIPFKQVKVYKEIAFNGSITSHCASMHANLYAKKVSAVIGNRSIRNMEPATRYVAPDDFYHQLVDRHCSRIQWATAANCVWFHSQWRDDCNQDGRASYINTAPLNIIANEIGVDLAAYQFEFAPSNIKVRRYLLPAGTDVYQTIYFPDPEFPVYRASITGNMLIIEALCDTVADEDLITMQAFGLLAGEATWLESADQRYGKIIEMPRNKREALLHDLTNKYNIYSVGRFATWRNILLDDVVRDLDVIERMMNASNYGKSLIKHG